MKRRGFISNILLVNINLITACTLRIHTSNLKGLVPSLKSKPSSSKGEPQTPKMHEVNFLPEQLKNIRIPLKTYSFSLENPHNRTIIWKGFLELSISKDRTLYWKKVG